MKKMFFFFCFFTVLCVPLLAMQQQDNDVLAHKMDKQKKKKPFFGYHFKNELGRFARVNCGNWNDVGLVRALVQGPKGEIGIILKGNENIKGAVITQPLSLVSKYETQTCTVTIEYMFYQEDLFAVGKIKVPYSCLVTNNGCVYAFDEKTKETIKKHEWTNGIMLGEF